jgi:hypothetical protein
MRLDEALQGILRLGIDTAPFIYFVERHPDYLGLSGSKMSHSLKDIGMCFTEAETFAFYQLTLPLPKLPPT